MTRLRKHLRARVSARLSTSAAWFLPLGLLASPALAQEQVSPTAATAQSTGAGDTGVVDIVVTAQRRSERLQDVPLSVTVTTGQALESGAVRTLTDFANRQPSFFILQAPAGDQLSIRGTGSGANGGFEQAVGTFVDGLYRNRARSTRVALFDVDRVEVLKGPQTTFFGANAIAGALNITTRKPTKVLEGFGSALYSPTDGEYNFEAGVGGPVLPGVGLRIAGRFNGMNGYIYNRRLGSDFPRNRDWQVRVSTRIEPTSNLTIDARFDYARNRDAGSYQFEVVNCPPAGRAPSAYCSFVLANNGGSIDDRLDYRTDSKKTYSNIDMYEGEVTTKLDLGAAALISTTGYFSQRYGGKSNLFPFPGPDPINSGSNDSFAVLNENFHQFSQELRLESSVSGPFKYMAGFYYEKNDLNYVFTSSSNSSIPTLGSRAALQAVGYTPATPLGYVRTVNPEARTLSGFASFRYDFTEHFGATASLRYSTVHKTTDNLRIQYGIVPTSGLPGEFIFGNAAQQAALAAAIPLTSIYPVRERTDDGWMPAAALQYKFNRDVMAYASFVKGFKAGGFSSSNNQLFDPEHAKTYEIGLKSTLLGRRLQANIALFRTDYTNLQESQAIFSPASNTFATVITNAAKSRSSGVELSLVARPTRRLTLSTDVAYLDSHYIRFPGAACYAGQTVAQGCPANGSGQTLDGRTRMFAPKWSGSANAEYEFPLAESLNLRFGGTVYFKSSYNLVSSLNPASTQRAYSKVDLRATLATTGGAEIGVIAKNIFNRKTLLYFDDLPGSIGTYNGMLDRPRSIAITGTIRF